MCGRMKDHAIVYLRDHFLIRSKGFSMDVSRALPSRGDLLALALAFASLLLQGCAAPEPVLVKPSTPSALVSDGSTGGGMGGGAFFVLLEVDGVPVGRNSLDASLRASAGRGANLTVVGVERYVGAGRHKLKLSARYAHAAPIQAMFSSASGWKVEGDVEVELRPDVRYRVNGLLDNLRREIWLEEADSGKLVSARIGALENARVAVDPPGSTFACCNLRYDGDWIGDNNGVPLPFIPAGTRVEVKRFGRSHVDVEILGSRMRIGPDQAAHVITKEAWLERLVVKEDPRPRIAAASPAVREAIVAGKVTIGMTRDEALIALGHPRPDRTPALQAGAWQYWTADDEAYTLSWGADGRLAKVDAVAKVRALVMHSRD